MRAGQGPATDELAEIKAGQRRGDQAGGRAWPGTGELRVRSTPDVLSGCEGERWPILPPLRLSTHTLSLGPLEALDYLCDVFGHVSLASLIIQMGLGR